MNQATPSTVTADEHGTAIAPLECTCPPTQIQPTFLVFLCVAFETMCSENRLHIRNEIYRSFGRRRQQCRKLLPISATRSKILGYFFRRQCPAVDRDQVQFTKPRAITGQFIGQEQAKFVPPVRQVAR